MQMINGNLIYHAKNAAINLKGKEGFDEVVAQMNHKAKEVMISPILSTEMYPISVLDEFMLCYVKLYGMESLKEAVHSTAKEQFKTVFRFTLKLLPSKKIIPMIFKRMWGTLFNFGKTISVDIVAENATVKVEDCVVSKIFLLATSWWLEIFFSKALNKEIKGKAKQKTNSIILEFN